MLFGFPWQNPRYGWQYRVVYFRGRSFRSDPEEDCCPLTNHRRQSAPIPLKHRGNPFRARARVVVLRDGSTIYIRVNAQFILRLLRSRAAWRAWGSDSKINRHDDVFDFHIAIIRQEQDIAVGVLMPGPSLTFFADDQQIRLALTLISAAIFVGLAFRSPRWNIPVYLHHCLLDIEPQYPLLFVDRVFRGKTL